MAKMKINVCVIFFLCLIFLVGFGSSDQSQNLNTNENENPSPSEGSDFSFLRQYLTVFQKSVGELEKFHAEFKELKAAYKKVDELIEQVKLLSAKVDGISEDDGVWFLTPPLRGPKGEKGDKGDSAVSKPQEESPTSDSDPQPEVSAESCVPEEKWVNLHELNNTSPADVKTVVNATVGFFIQNSTDSGNSVDEDTAGISHAFLQAENFARIGKSNSTDFDWTSTPFHIWTRKTAVSKTYTCKAQSSCVLKQLVGHCGNSRVPVDKFSQVSIPEFAADSKILSCSYAMEILPSPRSKKQTIYPHGNTYKVDVLCDFEADGGGWTIIQKRSSGPKEEFNQNWNEYAKGFGSLDGNFWLGLENIHALTKNGDQELRIELEDFEGAKRFAQYSRFSISDASDFYRLAISGFYQNSTAGDSITNTINYVSSNGWRFSTKDKDHDSHDSLNCAEHYSTGGWWVSDTSDDPRIIIQNTKQKTNI